MRQRFNQLPGYKEVSQNSLHVQQGKNDKQLLIKKEYFNAHNFFKLPDISLVC